MHDLSSLAAFVSQSGVVVCSVFSSGFREFAANWMYSLSRFGGVKEALLFTFDEGSLRECLNLGFACYIPERNMIAEMGSTADKTIEYGSQKWTDVST